MANPFDKVSDFLDDIVPNEIKPYLGTLAATAVPGLLPIPGGGLGGFLAGAGTDVLMQKLLYGSDEDRDTDYLSAGMSGALAGLANLNVDRRTVDLKKAGVTDRGVDFNKTNKDLILEAQAMGIDPKLSISDLSNLDAQAPRFTATSGVKTNADLLARLNAKEAFPGKGNYFASDFQQGLKDFATPFGVDNKPFNLSEIGASGASLKDVGKELLSTSSMLQLGQTPSQMKNAADALKDAERRYQEYLDQLSADQRASVEEDRQARISAYKEYLGLAGYSNEEIDKALFQAGHIGEGETVYAARGGRIGFDVGGDTGGKTDNMGIGNYIEAEKVRAEYTDKLKRMLQAERVKMKMNDPGLMRFANALMPGGEGFYTKQEMRFPDMEARYKANIEKMKMDQAKDDYEKDQIKKQLRKDEFDDIVNMIDDRFSDNREQRKMASVGGRMTSEGDPISPDVPEGMQMDLRPGGFIPLGTKPKADDVPAMVGKNEFVLNDEAVSGIGKMLTGKPDPRAGARALYDLQSKMEAIV